MLSNYRVLDLTDGGSLICGQILGDLGADVIVVEPPEGATVRHSGWYADDDHDPDKSLDWWALNRNKRGITLNLESDAGREQLWELARHSDVIVESFGPGGMEARGLGYEEMSRANPGLVMVSITPFGLEGPKAQWAASDLTVMASSGAHLMTGDDDRPPCVVSVPQAFLHAGAEAAVGALVALAGREKTGAGQRVDVSAQVAAMMATQATVLEHGWGAQVTQRMSGGVKFGGIPLRFINPAKDGYVSVTFLFGSAIGPFSRRLMEVMCEDGVVDEATRDKDWINYTGLILSGQEPVSEFLRCLDAIGDFTKKHTKEELFKLGMERGLLIVPVAEVNEVVDSPQLAARDYWHQVEHEELGRTVTYPGGFAQLSATPITTRRRPPRVGEHNEEVAAEARSRGPVVAGGATNGSRAELPLAGLKVVDFMWVVAGPWSTRYLADFGATVVRVESSTRVDTIRTIGPFKDGVPGPERSGAHATVNSGKYGLSLKLNSEEGRKVALKLVEWADVVTESYTPGAMARLGLDYESVRKVNPNVIMISSCLNGQTGPFATLAGFGTMGAQIAGFGDLAGWPDRAPAGPAGAYTDYIAPKFEAAALLAALEHRRRTGEGQYIDFSQAEASAHFISSAILDYTVNGRVQSRRGNRSLAYAPHGVYPVAGEDRWVAIAVTSEQQWTQLVSAMGHAEWTGDSRFSSVESRRANEEALNELIAEWTRTRSADDVEMALQGARVPVHRVASSADAFADPGIASRGHLVTVEHPELGPVPIEAPRFILSATPAGTPAWPGPVYGQHNDEVLRGILGMDDEEIVELIAAGALE
jgi:crotonobetainyl-CoA:carnitine CoA-transferase CaiB-like acyl-CoA transferase